MVFDPNQKKFTSDYQRKVWQIGTHIIPLDVSLLNITDSDTREGCMQFYNCIMEIVTDMYNNWEEYVEAFYKQFNSDDLIKEKYNKLMKSLKSGKDFALICYEKDYIHCHRYLLAQKFIEQGIEWKEI
jgi:hypothetical protein